jgi:hypothetical protein
LVEWFINAVSWFFDTWITVIIFGSFGMMIFLLLVLMLIGSFMKNLMKNW